VDFGVHLPLIEFEEEGFSLGRLEATTEAAVDCGFAAISANDHFVFQAPWLDGPTALASVIARSGGLTLATTVSLPVLRGPVPLAKALAAIDVLSDGPVIAGVGPGSSERDYAAIGVPFEERWARFEEALHLLRALLEGESPPEGRYFSVPTDLRLAPPVRRGRSVELWVGSWGSRAGLARVARLADGWLASAYNTTPEVFAEGRVRLAEELERQGRPAEDFPNALATMWTWVSPDRAECDRLLDEVLAPLLRRDPAELRQRVCVGTPEQCAELLSRYARAGCERVYLWPLGDERRQLERVAAELIPAVDGS
jgi:alkanesulfonate monooxygenase SsuD/methylene tetrahydromethanopterin reductase-like flavin-dependent oxidoreductase (luciferase family)